MRTFDRITSVGGDMKLTVLTKENCEQVRQWRNECLYALRTPYMLTQEQQERFYNDVVCCRDARARFWGVVVDAPHTEFKKYEYNCGTKLDTPIIIQEEVPNTFIGMIGLENIEIENRRAEISIIINPEYQGKGHGEKAVELLLEQGFLYLNLENIWGECYMCNPAMGFWSIFADKYDRGGDHEVMIVMPNTKYYKGHYHDSMFFNIAKEDWLKCRR